MARVIVTVLVLLILIAICTLGFAFLFPERTINTPLYKVSQFLNQFRLQNNDFSKYTVNQYNLAFEHPKNWKVEETRFADCEEYDTTNGNQPCSFVTISGDKAEVVMKVSSEKENGKMYGWGESDDINKTGTVNVDGRDLDVREVKESGKKRFVIFGDSTTYNINGLNFLIRLQQKSNSAEDYYAGELDNDSINIAKKIVDSIDIQ